MSSAPVPRLAVPLCGAMPVVRGWRGAAPGKAPPLSPGCLTGTVASAWFMTPGTAQKPGLSRDPVTFLSRFSVTKEREKGLGSCQRLFLDWRGGLVLEPKFQRVPGKEGHRPRGLRGGRHTEREPLGDPGSRCRQVCAHTRSLCTCLHPGISGHGCGQGCSHLNSSSGKC